jgi:uncharacterized membrane protein
MLVFSTVQYSRFGLTNDFANYSQAWWEVAHGQLDPFMTGFGVPFWRDNAEFILWPLSLLYYVDPHPITLLWVQDIVVVLTELVTFVWILKVIERARGRVRHPAGTWLALGAAVVLVADPWAYETIAFDFHFEPIAALFTVLVGYNLWAGRIRRLWWLVPLALVSHVLAGTYLVGVGLSGILAGPRTRRPGIVLAAVGVAWVYVFTALGAAGVDGKLVNSSYTYLVGPHHGRVGVFAVVAGAFGHPGAVAHVVASHWPVAAGFLVVVGAIGVLSPWGLGMALVVLVPNLLDGSGLFINVTASFQSWPALPFVLVGSVMVLLRLLEGGAMARRVAVVVGVVWATILGELAFIGLPSMLRTWMYVAPPVAAELAHVEAAVPSDAEVIVSFGVMGRFAQRSSIYAFERADQTVPVNRRVVVFVLAPKLPNDDPLTQHDITAAAGFVSDRLGARTLGSGSGVDAFVWSPPRGTTRVTLP